MSVLFIGGVFADVNQAEIIENTKGYAEFSANIFQQKLINGFLQNNCDIDVISAPFISSYPNRYKKMFFKGFEKEQTDYKYVNFNNVWGWRNFSRAAALKKEIKRLYKNGKKYDLVVVYSAHQPFLDAAVYAKKLFGAKINFVVPDLPQYMNLDANKTKIYDLLKKVDIKRMNKCIKYVDSFVVLTEGMKDMLSVGDRPCFVAEGIIAEAPAKDKQQNVNEIKTIAYAGKMNDAFGLRDLTDAFTKLSGENYRLVLCGDGDSREYVKEKAKLDKRIDYKGQVAPDVAKEIMNNASVLVNPRPNDSEYTKYSFPSKNIEYLQSGKPVVCYLLDGMPKIYADFIYEIKSKDTLSKTLEAALTADNSEKYSSFCSYAEKNLLASSIADKILKL